MTPVQRRPGRITLDHLLSGIQLCLAFGLLVFGLGNLTDVITWTLPPVALFGIAIYFFAYAAFLWRQS